jgi:hypothetical protein
MSLRAERTRPGLGIIEPCLPSVGLRQLLSIRSAVAAECLRQNIVRRAPGRAGWLV